MIAVDTNVLIYAIDRSDAVKWAKARALLTQLRAGPRPPAMPWQVLGEFVRYLRAWEVRGEISRAGLLRYVTYFRSSLTLAMPTPRVLDLALSLSERYSLSHWDSMPLGACVDAGIDTLYTEDMGAPAQYDSVQLRNPFV